MWTIFCCLLLYSNLIHALLPINMPEGNYYISVMDKKNASMASINFYMSLNVSQVDDVTLSADATDALYFQLKYTSLDSIEFTLQCLRPSSLLHKSYLHLKKTNDPKHPYHFTFSHEAKTTFSMNRKVNHDSYFLQVLNKEFEIQVDEDDSQPLHPVIVYHTQSSHRPFLDLRLNGPRIIPGFQFISCKKFQSQLPALKPKPIRIQNPLRNKLTTRTGKKYPFNCDKYVEDADDTNSSVKDKKNKKSVSNDSSMDGDSVEDSGYSPQKHFFETDDKDIFGSQEIDNNLISNDYHPHTSMLDKTVHPFVTMSNHDFYGALKSRIRRGYQPPQAFAQTLSSSSLKIIRVPPKPITLKSSKHQLPSIRSQFSKGFA